MSKSLPNYSAAQLEQHRTINVEDGEWATYHKDALSERMDAIGVYVGEVFWSGFWSQGDGAMFEGHIFNWDKYLRHLGYTDDILIDTAQNYWAYRWEHRGHYHHEYSVLYHDEVYLPDNPYDEEDDSLRHAVWQATMDRHDLLALTEQIQEDLRDHMRDLYKKLEQEYDDLTSDEAVIEALVVNDIEPETD